MSHNYSLEFRADHVVVQLTPNFELSPATLRGHWAAVTAFCQEHQCAKVLSLATNPHRSLNTMDAYDSGKSAASSGLALKVACYWQGYEPDELTRFFQTVAANRGMEVEYFASLPAALAWLDVDIRAT
ncbi:hypothetical protein NA78x_000837 [Anatilimnocola sp. NA78]|uniref:hypothetical protein n=1 Tax=Anatilimnocola sp. NA78 TaxID=3415683 RepID=UPI003CE452E0